MSYIRHQWHSDEKCDLQNQWRSVKMTIMSEIRRQWRRVKMSDDKNCGAVLKCLTSDISGAVL